MQKTRKYKTCISLVMAYPADKRAVPPKTKTFICTTQMKILRAITGRLKTTHQKWNHERRVQRTWRPKMDKTEKKRMSPNRKDRIARDRKPTERRWKGHLNDGNINLTRLNWQTQVYELPKKEEEDNKNK